MAEVRLCIENSRSNSIFQGHNSEPLPGQSAQIESPLSEPLPSAVRKPVPSGRLPRRLLNHHGFVSREEVLLAVAEAIYHSNEPPVKSASSLLTLLSESSRRPSTNSSPLLPPSPMTSTSIPNSPQILSAPKSILSRSTYMFASSYGVDDSQQPENF